MNICSNCTVSYLCQSAARQQQVLSRTDPKQFPQALCIAEGKLGLGRSTRPKRSGFLALEGVLTPGAMLARFNYMHFYIYHIEWLLTLPIHFDSIIWIIHNNPMFNPKVPTFWHSTKWTNSASQEIERYNMLLSSVRSSIKTLQKGIQGRQSLEKIAAFVPFKVGDFFTKSGMGIISPSLN